MGKSSRKRGQKGSSSMKAAAGGLRKFVSTAKKELNGKQPFRGGSNKTPPSAHILGEKDSMQPLPKRNKRNELVFADHPEFRPNLTPQEVLQLGSFGGTYFRPITSGVTGQRYRNVHKEFPATWFDGIDVKACVTSS